MYELGSFINLKFRKYMTFANPLSTTQENTFARDAIIVVLSGLLITLMGQFSIPLPFTPVSISFRFQTILLLSVLLGSKRAVLACSVFLVQGAFGLPVFAGGTSGLVGLLGPSGGYIVGYLIAAFVVGWISEKSKKAIPALLAGTLIVYACGSVYLSTFIGIQNAILLGVLPFVFGDLLKTAAVLKILDRMGWQKNNV
jgi:biotin transport system substrate-specific component